MSLQPQRGLVVHPFPSYPLFHSPAPAWQTGAGQSPPRMAFLPRSLATQDLLGPWEEWCQDSCLLGPCWASLLLGWLAPRGCWELSSGSWLAHPRRAAGPFLTLHGPVTNFMLFCFSVCFFKIKFVFISQ